MRFRRAQREFQGMTAEDYIRRTGGNGPSPVHVDQDSAMRHSAVWAAIRLRADLISTFPLDVYRDARVPGETGTIAVEMPKPQVLLQPGGPQWDYIDWMYASQVDLDRCGNAIGLITDKDSLGLPRRIELQDSRICSCIQRTNGTLQYRIGGKLYDPDVIWHERQYVVPGFPLGLSPVAYGAWSIGQFLSIQDFVVKWFSGGTVPRGRMKNTAKKLNDDDVAKVKSWWRQTINTGDLLVHGNDWEYDLLTAEAADVSWLEGQKFGLTDIARFFNVPADLIEAPAVAGAGGTLTYQNITQRNLQFLIMNLGPAIIRREKRLSNLLPTPRYVKLNTDALLRMDPVARAALIKTRIDSRVLTNSEGRALDNLPPLTEADKQEFIEIYGKPKAPGSGSGDGSSGGNSDSQGAAPPVDQTNQSAAKSGLVEIEAEMIVREARRTRKELTA